MPGGNKKITAEDGRQFSSDYQPKNRRRRDVLSVYRKMLYDEAGELIIDDAIDIETGDRVKVKVTIDSVEKLALHYHDRIFKNDRVLLDFIDRDSGKPKQTHAIEIKMEGFETGLIFPEQIPVVEFLLMVGSGQVENDREKFKLIMEECMNRTEHKLIE